MDQKIKVLPKAVANQIAAGEVVQRPASAVKELLENALDSGARQITLNIKDAGKALIQVIDNGHGMSEKDALLSVERHATSKISQLDDLFKIFTMGFRGEALASIAAVSQLELKTRDGASDLATVITMKGSEVESQSLNSGKIGTTVSVKNLFFNVPARRNFLKSDNVENKHIIEVFQQTALSRPEIAFALYNNGEEVYNFPIANFKQRIIQLFGKRFNERLIPIDEETEIVNISGFVGKPEFATIKRGEQFFMVNGRFIKSPYLHHAVMTAFEDLLPKNMFPQYFINLDVDPAQIDINIHPTKTEIKFQEERSIYAILRTTIRQSLGKFNIAPSLDFERETAFDGLGIDRNRSIKIPEIQVDKNYDPFKSKSILIQKSPTQSMEGNEAQLLYQTETVREEVPMTAGPSTESKMSDMENTVSSEKSKIVQFHNKFILTHIKSGMMIIDQHRAHQRILYEKFILGKERIRPSQKLLFPVLIEINPADSKLIDELMGDFQKLGFSIEDFGKESLSINGAPPDCAEKQIKEVFLGVIEEFKHSGSKDKNETYDKLSVLLASKMAIKNGQKLHEKEMEHLIDQLFACAMPYSLPNGKPIIITLSLDELGKKFQY